MGAFFQDDWKVTRNLTLNLGLRYDLYSRHHELNDFVTTFIKGPGSNFIDDITTGAGQIKDANTPAGLPGCAPTQQVAQAQLAGVCGPGGFTTAKTLGKGDHNNFGSERGFCMGHVRNAKTSLRGGFGVAYEGTLYNPLSNSRWNLPYYSFNAASNFLGGDVNTVIYGPYTCTGLPGVAHRIRSTAPTFAGAPTNPAPGHGRASSSAI